MVLKSMARGTGKKVLNFLECFAAAQRHLTAWFQGEDKDEETANNHLAHASCCILYLLAYSKRDMKDIDDRPHHKVKGSDKKEMKEKTQANKTQYEQISNILECPDQ